MRSLLVAVLLSSATAASAGPLDLFGGIPDAPGVVQGGSFGLTGNDYWTQRGGAVAPAIRTKQHAKARPRHATGDKRPPRS
ncbi:hypothetical protein [Methylobacterium gossipiicola]|uniref:Uncharacterized protein n=1 Tax=Methylobacterium gossipiicola TaxID=582675 RepID=A0A1I2VRS9_9HYPH|nr:hypothetical protein [Methylobacterium gossipiicola]SFG91872.1 hypothetical protein SAMN05192565_1179 [Methylobacterium gossipiicola]